MSSDLRSFNYKVLFGALYTADKFVNVKNNNKCVLCFKKKETCKHIFSECEVTVLLYEEYSKRFSKNNIRNKNLYEEIIIMSSVSTEVIINISIFKYALWNYRIIIKYEHNRKEEMF